MVTWLADRERITPITAVRILYRPLDYVNLISQRIFREKALVPAKLRKSIETGALIAFAMIIPLLAFVVFVVPLLWLLSPAIITIVAAMLCLRVAHTGILEYVGVTALTDADVIKGLVSGVLARLEYWTLAVTVIVPLVLLAFIAPAAGLVMTHGDLDDGLYGLAAHTAMLIGLTGANVLGAALGVLLALWQRDLVALVIGAPAMLLFVGGGLAGFMLVIEAPPIGLLYSALYMVAPYYLAAGAMNLSRRWIRQIA